MKKKTNYWKGLSKAYFEAIEKVFTDLEKDGFMFVTKQTDGSGDYGSKEVFISLRFVQEKISQEVDKNLKKMGLEKI